MTGAVIEPLRPCGPELAWDNRRILARRLAWPAGALEECERLEGEFPNWWITWSAGNSVLGFERPAGYYAQERWPYAGRFERRANAATAELLAGRLAQTIPSTTTERGNR